VTSTLAPAAEARELSWPDQRLVRECLKGNEEAWAALIERYKNLIFSVPIRYGLSRDDAADIFQSVCVDWLAELQRLREPKALPAWLIRVSYHKCFHWKRQQERYVPEEPEQAERRPSSANEIPDHVFHELEQGQVLREALRGLSPRCRQLIHMLFFETPARPYQEVAESLGLATGSIGFIRGRCLDKLREHLEEKGFE
jgi:RNA polymerase sigma factor (sigma-70 family)